MDEQSDPPLPSTSVDRELQCLQLTHTAPHVPANFLDMSGEIRNQIYEQFILDVLPSANEQASGQPGSGYASRSASVPGDLAYIHRSEICTFPTIALPLAQVNKQLRAEYFDMLLLKVEFEVTWLQFNSSITSHFLATGAGAQPGTMSVEVDSLATYSGIDLVPLIRLQQRGGYNTKSRDVAFEAKLPTHNYPALLSFCRKLEYIVHDLNHYKVSFRPSKVPGTSATSFGAFTHIYVHQGVKPTGNGVWNKDILIVLEESWKTLSKSEWHVLVMLHVVLGNIPGATIKVDENIEGTVRHYTCQKTNHSGLRLVPVAENTENSALE